MADIPACVHKPCDFLALFLSDSWGQWFSLPPPTPWSSGLLILLACLHERPVLVGAGCHGKLAASGPCSPSARWASEGLPAFPHQERAPCGSAKAAESMDPKSGLSTVPFQPPCPHPSLNNWPRPVLLPRLWRRREAPECVENRKGVVFSTLRQRHFFPSSSQVLCHIC